MRCLGEELVRCARDGDLEGVREMLEVGADVYFYDDKALRWASRRGHVGVVEILLRAGADVHACNDEALRWASRRGYVGVVEILLRAGADVHADEDCALYNACHYGHVGVAIKLVEAGADLRVLQRYWVRLFGCDAPRGLVKVSIREVVELMVARAVAGELVA